MTPLLLRSSLRHLLRHPWQLGLTTLGVALGVAVVVAIDLAVQSSREAFRLSTLAVAGRSTHQVVGGPSGVPDDLVARIRLEAGLREAAPVVEGYVTAPALPGTPLRVLGVDPFSELPFRPYLAGGAAGLDVAGLLTEPGAALLSAETAARAGVGVGDRLEVRAAGAWRTLRVGGVLEAGDALSRGGLRDLLVVDVAEAQALLGREGLTRVDLAVPAGAEEAATLARVRAVLEPGLSLVETGRRTAALSEMIRAFDLNLSALSLLALLFGAFLVYNTMTFSVVQRRPIIGGMRALGVTRREVTGLVLGEAALLGAAGTALGLLLGVLLGRGLVRLVARTINDLWFAVSVQGLVIPGSVLAKGAALGVGTAVLAALIPALEATRAPPRATLTRSTLEARARRAVPRAALAGVALGGVGAALLLVPSSDVVPAFAGLFAVVVGMALLTPLGTVAFMRLVRPAVGRLVGILGVLAARGVVAALSRTAPAAAALVVAVAVTVGLGIMISSFRSTVARWLDVTLEADVYVALPGVVRSRPEGTLPAGLPDRLASVEGVVGMNRYRGVFLETEEGPVRVVAVDLHLRGERGFELLLGDPATAFAALRREEAVFVSESYAFRRGVGPGDTVRLPTDRGERGFPVAAVFRDYGTDRGVVTLARATYDRWWTDAGVTSLGLFLEPAADPDRVMEQLRAQTAPGREVLIRSNRDLREASLEVFDRTFAITGVLRVLAFLVAFIGVMAALMELQLERGRELGVLRANGLTPGQVWGLVTAQTGLVGLAAGLMAVPVGLVMAVVMVFVVNRRSFGWTLRMEVGPEVLLQALALAVVAALLAGLYPAWCMSRTLPAAALREE